MHCIIDYGCSSGETEKLNSRGALTGYRDVLITLNPPNRTFRFYKIHKKPNRGKPCSLHLERQQTVNGESEPWKPDLLEVLEYDNRTIIVVVLKYVSRPHAWCSLENYWFFEVYDFHTLELLAKQKRLVAISKSFFSWKRQVLVDNSLQVFHLDENQQQTQKNNLPFSIRWHGDLSDGISSDKAYNIGDHMVVTSQSTNKLFSLPKQDIVFYHWKEASEEFRLTNMKLNTDKSSISQRKRTEGLLQKAFSISDKFITIIRTAHAQATKQAWDKAKIQLSPQRVFVWNMNGEMDTEILVGEGSLIPWNNVLMEICERIPERTESDVDSDSETEIVEPRNPEVKLWSLRGELIDTISIEVPIHHVWNHHLVIVFPDSIQIFQLNLWGTERLLWLGWLKNRGTSSLSTLPKEILKCIIELVRQNPELVSAKASIPKHSKRTSMHAPSKSKKVKKQ